MNPTKKPAFETNLTFLKENYLYSEHYTPLTDYIIL